MVSYGAELAASPAVRIAVLPTQYAATAVGRVPASVLNKTVFTAVQDASRYDVVGQDDSNATPDFERTNELAGCDDARCFAEIGSALGVDRILVVKLARVENEWTWPPRSSS